MDGKDDTVRLRKAADTKSDDAAQETPAPKQKGSAKSSIGKVKKSTAAAVPTPTGPKIPRPVMLKLGLFTLLMFTLPIGLYFYSLEYLFKGNTTYSAIVAVVAANAVLISYVITAFVEDQGDQQAEADAKKSK
ncbi:vacuolar ATPase assembly integral membrane protein vma21 [Chytridiales sp. JEL 0842]|nr:vacuolar ATPase assembly integral membrane protein vma21 [Chytridiales sp. JEL 0842]